MTPDHPLVELALDFAAIGHDLARLEDPTSVYEALCRLAVERVPGAQYAGVTIGRGGSFTTVGATADIVDRVDAIQYRLGTGPCVDAAEQQENFRADDLRTDPRWPVFGPEAYGTEGIASMLSQRLYLEDVDQAVVACLNMYSTRATAFEDPASTYAVLLATHGAIAVASAASRQKAANLALALMNSREIGIAMGIIMAGVKVTRDQAFDLLRIASQHTHHKLAAVARDVADTGRMPPLPE